MTSRPRIAWSASVQSPVEMPFRYRTGQQLLDVLGPSQVRRYQLAREARFPMARQHAVIDARRRDLHGTGPRDDGTNGPVAVPNDLTVSLLIHEVLVPLQEHVRFDFDGALQQLSRPLPHDFIQWQPWQTSVWAFGP